MLKKWQINGLWWCLKSRWKHFVSWKAFPCRSGIVYHWRAFCLCPIDVCLVLVIRISSGLTRWLLETMRRERKQQQQQQKANLTLFFLNSGQNNAYTAVFTQELDAGAINVSQSCKSSFRSISNPSRTRYSSKKLNKILGPQQRTNPRTAKTNKRIDFDLCFATALWMAPFLLLFHKRTATLVYATIM